MDILVYRIRVGLAALVDVVLPRSRRRMKAESMEPENLVAAPMTSEMLGKSVTTLSEYATLKDLIQSLKYDRSIRSAHLLASLLADYLREDITARKLFTTKPVFLIPVPLDDARKRARGYNQIGLVIDSLPEEFQDGTISRIGAPLLERVRRTAPQTQLARSERLSNVAGAFAVSDPELLHDTIVYLIDDVATTGATLVNAAHPLTRAGAEVTLLALARA